MRIEKLRLVNFGNYTDEEINLAPVSVFVGKNGAGKSTIKQAIEYLFTGRVNGVTDGSGRGSEQLIRTGEKSGYVAGVVDGRNISREIPGKLQGMEEPPNREVIAALMNTSKFLELPQKEQQSLLFSLLGLKFTAVRITELLLDWPKAGDKETGYFKQSKAAVDAVGGPEVFESLYKYFYSERTAAKRLKQELSALAKDGDEKDDLPAGAWEAKEQIREELARLKKQRNELLKSLGEAGAGVKRKEVVQYDIKRLEDERQELQAKIDSVQVGGARAEANYRESLDEDLKKLDEAVQAKVAEQTKALKECAARRAVFEEHQKAVTVFSNDEVSCPVYPELACPGNSKAILKKIKEDLKNSAADLSASLTNRAKIDEELQNLLKEQAAVNKMLQEQKDTIYDLEQDRKKLAELDKRIGAFRTELEGLENAQSPAELQEEVDALGQRIANGDELVRKLDIRETNEQYQADIKEKASRAAEEVDILEVLVEAFGPKGIRVKLLTNVIDQLQARAAGRMELLTGGVYRVEFTPEITPVIFKNGIQVPLRKLSTGERLLLGVVMQDILSGLTRLRLLVVDDANHLDQANKNALLGMMMQVRQDYDTVIVMSVLGEVEPKDPGIEGLGMYLVEDGTVKQIVRLNEGVANE
ncbi:MAG: AAA family ATPase [Eubacteriales bacterium]